ncbi:MAG: hypothetical protein HY673_25090, partial [Chloroflexi bacterium]|nr:hypothetical protein [Chloroflexota bacterium]
MNPKPSLFVAIETLGCKLNQAESQAIARAFLQKGYRIAAPGDACDVFVLNTCTVTHVADRKVRNLLRQARKQNPSALVVATGCLAERATEELANISGIDLVLGNAEKETLPDRIEELLRENHPDKIAVPLAECHPEPSRRVFSPRGRTGERFFDSDSLTLVSAQNDIVTLSRSPERSEGAVEGSFPPSRPEGFFAFAQNDIVTLSRSPERSEGAVQGSFPPSRPEGFFAFAQNDIVTLSRSPE